MILLIEQPPDPPYVVSIMEYPSGRGIHREKVSLALLILEK